MTVQRIGGRELGYAFYPSVATGSSAQSVSKAGDGVPRGAVDGALGPGVSRPLIFTLEILLPAMTATSFANFDTTYPFLAGSSTTRLPILQWAKGMTTLGAFTKQSLAIYDAHIWLGTTGAQVTDLDTTLGQTNVRTKLEADDGNGSYVPAFQSNSAPDPDAYPYVGRFAWATSTGCLLNVNRPKLYMSVENLSAGTTNARHLRVALFGYET